MNRSGVTLPRRPPGWVAPGPRPAGAGQDPTLCVGPDEDLSFLAGDFRIFQPRRGHRWSLDDLLVAWVAVSSGDSQRAFRSVDLGCGLGSVLMLVAWACPNANVTGIEAQVERADRATRSLRYNGLSERCRVIHSDLRELTEPLLEVLAGANLVTGTPPYFDAEATRSATRAEAAACRVELRGGLEVYMDAASRLLATDGQLVLCYPEREGQRAVTAGLARGLSLQGRLTVVPRSEKQPLIVVDRFARSTPSHCVHHNLVVRDARGAWTDEFRAVRRAFGMPDAFSAQ